MTSPVDTEDPRWAILFLCTGNYYRSRFAELLWNARAKARGSQLRAISRGLRIPSDDRNPGPIAKTVLSALEERGIPVTKPIRMPRSVARDELLAARLVVALDRQEHHPMLLAQFPELEPRVTYWQVADIPHLEPQVALGRIEDLVNALVADPGLDP